MQISPSVRLKQKQSLVMTPQLQQAIKLLQMTNLEIHQFLEQQALENPFLEVAGEDKPESAQQPDAGTGPEDGPAELQQAMQEGAALGDDPTAHADYDNRFSSEGLDLGRNQGPVAADSHFDDLAARIANRPQGLHSFVRSQIDLEIRDTSDRIIAFLLADALEPTGWLGQPLDEIAALCGADLARAEKVLARLQKLEPAGLFARDLAECLRLQAADRGYLDRVMGCVLDNLDLLARGEMKALARKADCDREEIAACLQKIRTLNPKPAADFEDDITSASPPDVIVRRTETGWAVDLNRSTLPTLYIDEAYARDISAQTASRDLEKNRQFASEAVGSAKWLQRALEQRNSTTLKIAGEIVRRQSDFLEQGLSALKPLALRDVAEAIGMHESTVSRVTSGLMIATPKGSFTMKSFFSVSIATEDSGDGTAAAAVRGLIRQIVDGETPGKPLSDDAISALVAKKGIKLARRTVAKYREMLKIPSSSERRRQARMNMVS